MEFKRNINGNVYVFTANTWSTSRAWGHVCDLSKNGVNVAKERYRYYNRTWESYQFRSVMKGCVSKLFDELVKTKKQEYLAERGLKRLKSKREFLDYVATLDEAKELIELETSI